MTGLDFVRLLQTSLHSHFSWFARLLTRSVRALVRLFVRSCIFLLASTCMRSRSLAFLNEKKRRGVVV